MSSDLCPVYAPFFSAMGVACAIIFSSFGAAYGTAKSSVGCMSAGVIHPDLGVRAILPTVFAGILAIYGLVCSVLVANKITPQLSLYTSLINLGSGLAVGLSSLAAGFAIGIAGDAGVRSISMQPRLFVSMVLILIFAEVLGLYGMIVALILDTRASLGTKLCN